MKKKNVFTLLLILIAGSTVLSQTHVFPIKQEGSKKWGYASLDGNVFIEPKFSEASEFSGQGSAVVIIKNKFYIINRQGDVLENKVDKIRPMIDMVPPYSDKLLGLMYWVHTFSDGYFVVSQNKKWGCLGPDGDIVIPIKYDRLTDFNNGYALAELNNKFFVIDKSGREIPLGIAGIKEIKHFSEGLGIIEGKGEKWGFVDSNGKVAIEPQYTGVGYFSGGLAWARNDQKKIGFINKSGEWVIKPQFSRVRDFDLESGLAMVKVGDKWGYTDTKSNIHFFDETEKTFIFSEGLAVGRKNGEIGFLNNDGQWAIQPIFDVALGFKNGYAAVRSEGLWGIIDKGGNWIVQPTFSQVGDVAIIE